MSGPDPAELGLPERINQPYDAPDAASLMNAVRDYLRDDLMERTVGPDRWLLRVAANALEIAEREVRFGPRHHHDHLERLASLEMSSDRELSEAIRSGSFDDRWPEVLAIVRASVADSLEVANSGYSRP